MAQVDDEEALLLLLKANKKKYIKHLIEYAVGLNLCHNHPPGNFRTPLSETFAKSMELGVEEAHRLLVALSQLVELAVAAGFDFERNNLFSSDFDPQLKEVLLGSLSNLQN
jgi:hypothetical protein